MPQRIHVDNGTEFTSRALDHWAYWNHMALDFSRPGKPVDNAFVEAFNATVRQECLSRDWFTSIEDAQMILDTWRHDYANVRPHSSLGQQTPAQFRAGGNVTSARQRLRNLQPSGSGSGCGPISEISLNAP